MKNNLIQNKNIFTFTGLPEWDYLEFIVKTYKNSSGLASELNLLKLGDKLILSDKIDSIKYKGQGTFIAGGMGITPFISIFRFLNSKNKLNGNHLIFSIKNIADLILYNEFFEMLGENFKTILTEEKNCVYYYGGLDEKYLADQMKNPGKYYYVCGSNSFVNNINSMLINLNISPRYIELCN